MSTGYESGGLGAALKAGTILPPRFLWLLLLSIPVPVHGQCMYEMEILPHWDCGGVTSDSRMGAWSLNSHGHVVGWIAPCLGPNDLPCVWLGDDQIRLLPRPDGYVGGRALDINDKGEICGYVTIETTSKTGTSRRDHAAYWPDAFSEPIVIGVLPGARHGYAHAINNKTEVVGYSYDNIDGDPYDAFLWRDGKLMALELPMGPVGVAEDINDESTIIGRMGEIISGYSIFVWFKGEVTTVHPPSGWASLEARAIDAQGAIAGRAFLPAPNWLERDVHAFYFRNGNFTDLGTLPEMESSVAVGTNLGQVVGRSYRIPPPQPPDSVAFLWHGQGLVPLNSLVNTRDRLRIFSTEAINRKSQILADALVNSLGEVLVLTPNSPQADVDFNCRVNVDDLLVVINRWNMSGVEGDANEDGLVDLEDLILVIENWGEY